MIKVNPFFGLTFAEDEFRGNEGTVWAEPARRASETKCQVMTAGSITMVGPELKGPE